MGTKEPEHLENFRTFCMTENKEQERAFEKHGWRGNEGPDLVSHKGPLMPHEEIRIFFPFRHKEAVEEF